MAEGVAEALGVFVLAGVADGMEVAVMVGDGFSAPRVAGISLSGVAAELEGLPLGAGALCVLAMAPHPDASMNRRADSNVQNGVVFTRMD